MAGEGWASPQRNDAVLGGQIPVDRGLLGRRQRPVVHQHLRKVTLERLVPITLPDVVRRPRDTTGGTNTSPLPTTAPFTDTDADTDDPTEPAPCTTPTHAPSVTNPPPVLNHP